MNAPANRFVMRQGPTPGLVIDLSKSELTIGRDLGNDVVINDVEVSRRHVQLQLLGGRYRMEDLGSTNGTFVNGQRLMAPYTLVPGDQVSLGENVSLIYEAVPFDPAATQISSSAGASEIPVSPVGPAAPYAQVPKPQPAPRAAPTPAAQPKPVPTAYAPLPPAPEYDALAPAQYAGQVPAGPEIDAISPEEAPRKKPMNQWLLAGCGCLVVVACFLIALAVFIDQPWKDTGLYCTPPFDIIFRFFGYCP
jgi:hypothetical protein